MSVGQRTAPHPGTILSQLLKHHDLTLDQFASRTGLAVERLRGIVTRQRRIVVDSAAAIASGFIEEPWNAPECWLQAWDDYEHKRPARSPETRRCAHYRGQKINVELRERVLELVDSGLSSEEAGAEVGLGKMSVAGIRAADTKGQYS